MGIRTRTHLCYWSELLQCMHDTLPVDPGAMQG